MHLKGLIAVFDHVDHDADLAGGAAADEHLHDGVGVGDGGGFGGGDDDDVIGGGGEGEDVAADAGAGVDDEGVGGFAEGFEVGDDAAAVGFGEVGHLGEARGAGNQREAGGHLGDDIGERALPGDDVGEVEARLDVAEDVGVGEAEVGIEEDNAAAHGGEDAGEVDGKIGFADAAFAGGDGDGLGARPEERRAISRREVA